MATKYLIWQDHTIFIWGNITSGVRPKNKKSKLKNSLSQQYGFTVPYTRLQNATYPRRPIQ